jgi:hypothetical protein
VVYMGNDGEVSKTRLGVHTQESRRLSPSLVASGWLSEVARLL